MLIIAKGGSNMPCGCEAVTGNSDYHVYHFDGDIFYIDNIKDDFFSHT